METEQKYSDIHVDHKNMLNNISTMSIEHQFAVNVMKEMLSPSPDVLSEKTYDALMVSLNSIRSSAEQLQLICEFLHKQGK